MTKVLLIDDEKLACDLLAEYLETHSDMEVLGYCHDGFEAVRKIPQLQPDLLFLDVQMPKLSGLEVLELLDHPPAVIFITAFDHYAVRAFDQNAVDYLLKPLSAERLNQALDKYRQRSAPLAPNTEELRRHQALQGPARLVLKGEDGIVMLPYADIIYVQADDDYVHLHTAQGKFTQKRSLTHFEQRLPTEQFVRIHRSHLVHLQAIVKVQPYGKNTYVARLRNGQELPVSRRGYQVLQGKLAL